MDAREVAEHNWRVFLNLQPGDLLEFDRGRIKHWAVYVGNGDVVHFLGECNLGSDSKTCQSCVLSTCQGVIRRDKFRDVAGNSTVKKNNSNDTTSEPFQPCKIVERAESCVGVYLRYNIFFKNCEHFATWCRYGKKISHQASGPNVLRTVWATVWDWIRHALFNGRN